MQIPKVYIRIFSLCISVCLFLCACQKAPQNNLIYIDNTEEESGTYTESSAIGKNNATTIFERYTAAGGVMTPELEAHMAYYNM